MGNQTKISEQNGSPENAPRALARDVGEFTHDLVILAELQAQLFVADVKECRNRAFVPGVILLCGGAMGLACFPIALTALALLLIQVFETSYAAGFLIAAVVGAVASALVCVIGWFQLRDRVAVLRRSQQELIRNLHWIKNVLKRSRMTRRNGIDKPWRTVK